MNVVFLDFDGVLSTYHDKDNYMFNLQRRIAILSIICNKYNCKVVFESAHKDLIDEETLETDSDYINTIFNLFKKYNIECIGRTPNVKRYYSDHMYVPMWKEDEIRLYLFRHPEIDHYVVIDDDDLIRNSDLNKVRNHLIKTIYYSENDIDEEGLLEKHIEDAKEILKENNEIKKFALKKSKMKDFIK